MTSKTTIDNTADLVAEFLKKNKVTVFPPAHAGGNEAGKGTRITVVESRKEFRKERTIERRAEREANKRKLVRDTLELLRKSDTARIK